jgi:hypothetical protein
MSRTKVTLWLPTPTYHPRGWPEMLSWWNMKTPGNQHMRLICGYGRNQNIQNDWNFAVKTFMDTKPYSDVLFCMHEDIIAHPNTLMRLLSWDKPLVTALTFMKQTPTIPHIWKSYDPINQTGPYAIRVEDTYKWLMDHKENSIVSYPSVMEPCPDDALEEVSFTSMGCTIMRREMLEAMREPMKEKWFKWDEVGEGKDAGGEDRNFHEVARSLGMPGYVDRSCQVGHAIGEMAVHSLDFCMAMAVSTFLGTGEPEKEVKKGD